MPNAEYSTILPESVHSAFSIQHSAFTVARKRIDARIIGRLSVPRLSHGKESQMRVRQRLMFGLGIVLVLVGSAIVPIPAQSTAQPAQSAAQIVDAIRFREIGPTAQGGRYVEFAVVESNPRVFYAATATGGLWKTENHGVSFTSVFDDQRDFAIGAVALAQSRPETVYVGTGEANNSRSTYDGNGVYKSIDGGKSW